MYLQLEVHSKDAIYMRTLEANIYIYDVVGRILVSNTSLVLASRSNGNSRKQRVDREQI